jgi:hypothetical protein
MHPSRGSGQEGPELATTYDAAYRPFIVAKNVSAAQQLYGPISGIDLASAPNAVCRIAGFGVRASVPSGEGEEGMYKPLILLI